jgi:DNA-binding transcriptional MocR family regulator
LSFAPILGIHYVMTNWLPKRAALKRPVYRSLIEVMTAAIADGTLEAGLKLPTQRDLARRLGISLQTVGRAYDELIRRGLVVGEVGRGSYVRAGRGQARTPFLTEHAERGLIDLSILKPVVHGLHVERMRGALAALSQHLEPDTVLSFRPNVGLTRHREAAIGWLELCGLRTEPRNIVITNGVSQAMAVALTAVARAGDLVLTEEIGHHQLIPLASYLGLRLHGLEIDREGILPEAFEAACGSREVRALFLAPSYANPTASLMPEERRRAMVAIARQHNVYIIEDDAWGPLAENRPPPFAALAPERALYMTSFTKCLMPGLRSGYLVVPDALVAPVTSRQLAFAWTATPLVAEIAARWVTDGTARELLLWQRAALAERHAIVREVLRGVPHFTHPNCLHIWLPLPEGWSVDQLVTHARLRGVAVAPASAFAVNASTNPQAVRVSVGSPPSGAELRRGLEAVAGLIAAAPEPVSLAL